MSARTVIVAGTGTGIGKTHFAEALLLRWRERATVVGFKPVETGVRGGEGEDEGRLARASSRGVMSSTPTTTTSTPTATPTSTSTATATAISTATTTATTTPTRTPSPPSRTPSDAPPCPAHGPSCPARELPRPAPGSPRPVPEPPCPAPDLTCPAPPVPPPARAPHGPPRTSGPPWRFEPAISPHLAARLAGVTLTIDPIVDRAAHLARSADGLVIELAGGLFSPLGPSLLNAHLARALAEALRPCTLLLVAPDRLGVLHDVAATTLAAAALGLRPAGVVLMAPEHPDSSTGQNAAELPVVTDVPVVAALPRAPAAKLAQLPAMDELLHRVILG